MNLLKIGMGGVRLYLRILSCTFIISALGVANLSAQVDVKVEEVLGFGPMGEELICINPNPVQNEISIKHQQEIGLTKLRVVDSEGQLLYVIDLLIFSAFTLDLSSGNYHFIFDTDQGPISKQVIVI